MLKNMSLRHFALIDQLEFDFPAGLHILSGDTGAGKSLLFDAIHLLAGQKSDAIWVREGAPKADIRCEFILQPSLQEDQILMDKLVSLDLEDEENPEMLRLRRVIHKDGRSKAYINGVPVKASILKEITAQCFLFHDQHESMELLKADTQLQWLDRYAGNTTLIQGYKAAFDQWHGLVKEQNILIARQRDISQRRDYLEYQLQEMEHLNLEPEHIQQLESQVKSQDHAARWREQGESLLQLLDSDNEGLRHLRQWAHQIQNDRDPNPTCVAAAGLIESALVHLDEAEHEIQSINDIEYDEEQIQLAQSSLSALYELSRKHQVPTEELQVYRQNMLDELESLELDTQRLAQLDVAVAEAKSEVISQGQKLSQARQKAAPEMEAMFVRSLVPLGMPETQWQIQVNPLEEPRASGMDDVRFLLSPNKGHKPQPLAKIASGGELSRISLVLHVYGQGTQSNRKSQIYCFDEVDVGVSGQVAKAIGSLLQELAQQCQVFCISHAPQVAAQKGTHWLAEKKTLKGLVTTTWSQLEPKQREEEIARMLGKASKTELALAKQLLAT